MCGPSMHVDFSLFPLQVSDMQGAPADLVAAEQEVQRLQDTQDQLQELTQQAEGLRTTISQLEQQVKLPLLHPAWCPGCAEGDGA